LLSNHFAICSSDEILVLITYDARREVTNKTSLTPPSFIEVSVENQKNEWPFICVLGLSVIASYLLHSL
jgi:hypothetical protein